MPQAQTGKRLNRYSRPFHAMALEPLEQRLCMSVGLGTNLIVNGDAERSKGTSDGSAASTIPGWGFSGNEGDDMPAVVQYGASGGFPNASSPGSSNGGKNFFAGGPPGTAHVGASLFQKIDVSTFATDIDAGRIHYSLSGYFGGFSSQDDFAELQVTFVDALRSQKGYTEFGAVKAGDRGNVTGLLQRATSGVLPAGTRLIDINLVFSPSDSGYDDGYADNLSLTLSSTLGSKGQIHGTVKNDVNGNGAADTGDGALDGIGVFLDTNSNGILDKGEVSTAANSSGTYTFKDISHGKYTVEAILPKKHRATTNDPQSVTVASGLTSTTNFLFSQASVIAGTVFNDKNGDGNLDGGEAGIAGVTVFLDFNNNGELDDFELSLKTTSKGTYRFTVPFGSYVVREIAPKGFGQSGPKGLAYSLSLAKAKISKSNDFANI